MVVQTGSHLMQILQRRSHLLQQPHDVADEDDRVVVGVLKEQR